MLVSAGTMLLFAGLPLRAQDPAPESSSKPAEPPAPKKPDKKQKPDSGTQNAPDQPAWDPLRAEKDLEVGQYYMRKGDVDAAIDRFQDSLSVFGRGAREKRPEETGASVVFAIPGALPTRRRRR
jgi:hypothetical protein